MNDSSDPGPSALDLSEVLAQLRAHAIIVLDSEGHILDWRGGAEKIFGWSAAEVRGKPLDLLFTPEDRRQGAPAQELNVARAVGESPDDRWHLRKDGSRLWVEGVLSALSDRSGRLVGFVKLLRNRTESRGESDLMENRLAALEQAEARRGAFLATLIHELRGSLAPLANVRQIVEMLAPSHPQLEQPSRILSRQVTLMTRVIDDLVEMIRVGSGKLELKCERVDLNDLVRASIESCEEAARTRSQSLQALLPPGPTFCGVDPERIQQVLLNLITNALKYTPEGGHIWVQVTIEGDEAVIRVRDDGIGIPTEMQATIFDLFTQIPDVKNMSQGGLGLGLPLVRELVQLHGGNVQVHSDGENRGSEFVVKLPCFAPSAAEAAQSAR